MPANPSFAVKSRAMVLVLGLCTLRPALAQTRATPARAGKAATYEQVIEKGYAALGKGQVALAGSLAQKALATPDRYEGHLLSGMVAFRNEDLAGAEASLARALELAPAEGKEKVAQAQAVLKRRKSFLEHRQAGEEAEKNGLASKAAREFTAAWEADPGDEEIGLKAAKLWAERSGTPENAMPILAKLMENPKNFKTSDGARKIMDPLGAKLAPLAAEEMRKGFEQLVHGMYEKFENSGGIDHFKKAAVMTPGDPLPRLRLAEAYAFLYFDWKGAKDPKGPALAEKYRVEASTNLLAAFRCAASLQPTEVLKLLSLRPQLLRTMRDPAFRELYSDAFGPTAAAQAAELQRARFDQALGRGSGILARFDDLTDATNSKRYSTRSTLELTKKGFDLDCRDYMQSSYFENRSRQWEEREAVSWSRASMDFDKLLCVELGDWDWGTSDLGGVTHSLRLMAWEPVEVTTMYFRKEAKEKEKREKWYDISPKVNSWPNRLLDAFRAAGIDVLDHSHK